MSDHLTAQAQFAISEYTPRAPTYDTGWHATLAADYITWITPQPGETILDLACGTGLFSLLASTKVGSNGIVIGVDVTSAMLDVAQSKLNSSSELDSVQSNITFVEADISDPLLRNHPAIKSILTNRGGFDIIVCCSALVLLTDPAGALRQWSALLAPGGRMIIDTPTEDLTIQYLAGEILPRRLGLPVPFSRAWIKDSSSLEEVLRQARLEVERVWRTGSYTPETVYGVDRGDEVFETVVVGRYGKEWVGMGIEMMERAREGWRELWNESVVGRDVGGLRNGHWLYVGVGRKV